MKILYKKKGAHGAPWILQSPKGDLPLLGGLLGGDVCLPQHSVPSSLDATCAIVYSIQLKENEKRSRGINPLDLSRSNDSFYPLRITTILLGSSLTLKRAMNFLFSS